MKAKIVFVSGLILALIFGMSIPATYAATYYYDQDVTAYVAPSGSKTYYGTYPTKYRTAAVHPKTCGSPGSGTLFPRGTIIHGLYDLYLPGYGYRSTWVVEDMGDVNCSRIIEGYGRKLTRHWFDIYFGKSGTQDYNNAIKFGIETGYDYYIE
ncbi:hypothetical protein ACFO25_15365 [Paenactinomyces guangxiensis]|uniref:3D domain-containing protein n=1 Tax=Paenactinomyces guangxiensis TaxID=1490290 RepID=A0A7W1WTA0_9BACL|nr:hypothetical protein [Paenactinomyces guangxiensis]MBA4495582.1 hypothetical protein [Paenactinomyces guangxiensis]MBH8592840.1 hypothetical protein [Paenactinomyces guangxiensis]